MFSIGQTDTRSTQNYSSKPHKKTENQTLCCYFDLLSVLRRQISRLGVDLDLNSLKELSAGQNGAVVERVRVALAAGETLLVVVGVGRDAEVAVAECGPTLGLAVDGLVGGAGDYLVSYQFKNIE